MRLGITACETILLVPSSAEVYIQENTWYVSSGNVAIGIFYQYWYYNLPR